MIYREQPGRAVSGEAAHQGASADRRGLARFLPVSEGSVLAYGRGVREASARATREWG